MIHDLGYRLIADLSARAPDQNVFVSPVSIGMALALIADGAAGMTRVEILTTLGVPGVDQRELDQTFKDLVKRLSQIDKQHTQQMNSPWARAREPAAQADLANGLWLNKDIPFMPAFADHAREAYQAEVRGADFAARETVEIINRWVSERTKGKIDQIVDRTDAQTSLILINAVYFKGAWNEPFSAYRTREAPFTLPDGSQVACDLMHQCTDLPYVETDTFQMVLLPIAGIQFPDSDGAHLAVMLPKPGRSCVDVLEALGANWQASFARENRMLQEEKVDLWLPRFRIAYETSLKATLDALGMGVAFSDSADFSGITPISTKISEVKHKTTLVVNEIGAEAAAVTSVETQCFGMIYCEPVEMRVDRPFVCGIVLNPDLTPLFLGVINEPERTEPAV